MRGKLTALLLLLQVSDDDDDDDDDNNNNNNNNNNKSNTRSSVWPLSVVAAQVEKPIEGEEGKERTAM